MMKKILSSTWLGIVLIFVYFTIFILAVYSFLDTPTIGATGHFSLQNYVKLFTTPELREMIWGTLSLALMVWSLTAWYWHRLDCRSLSQLG